ncbi:MAG: hypothetical protein FWF50_01730 [Defluviitaleaceae bacterium]|nr:hypothetical protein [Defluviitaleaceae bacterium]
MSEKIKVKIKLYQIVLIIGSVLTAILIYVAFRDLQLSFQNINSLNRKINTQNQITQISINNYINFNKNMQTLKYLENYQKITSSKNISYTIAEINYGLYTNGLNRNRFELSNQQYSENMIITSLIVTGTVNEAVNSGTYESILSYLNFLRNTTYLVVLYNVSIQRLEHDIYFNIVLLIPNKL